MRLLLASLLFALHATGCIGGFVPPVRASASIGGALGTLHGVDALRVGGESRVNPMVVEARVAAHPLAYVHELSRRRLDFGFGYTGVFFPSDAPLSSQHGGHVEVGWYAVETESVRLELAARGELLEGRTTNIGGGGGLSMLFEVRHFAIGADSGTDGHGGFWGGAAWGEIAFGVRADATARYVDGDPCLAATIGIVVGAPVAIGGAAYPEAAVQMLRVFAH